MKLINVINPGIDLQQLKQFYQPGDIILLRQDAVYLSLRAGLLPTDFHCCVLATDITARQLTPRPEFAIIDQHDWVKLTAEAEQNLLC